MEDQYFRPMALNRAELAEMRELVGNIMSSRADILRQLADPRRDVNREAGFPSSGELTPEKFWDLFERDAIANRVVECLPKESWQIQPQVFEQERGETATPFEQDWDALGAGLRGEASWYQDEDGSGVWEYLLRLDILSRIGSYGVLLIGFDDGLPLSEPVRGVAEKFSMPRSRKPEGDEPAANDTVPDGVYEITFNVRKAEPEPTDTDDDAPPKPLPKPKPKGKGKRVVYLRAFPEVLAQVTQWESNPSSPRYGQPVMYLLTFNDPRDTNVGYTPPIGSQSVHWTRVLHVADNTLSNEVAGQPANKPVLNHVLSLSKIYAASGEGYWQNAFPKLVVKTQSPDVKVNVPKVREMLEDVRNSFQKELILMGLDATTLPPTVVDPTPHIEVHLNAICIKLGMPVRIFKGSERGELASNQDDAAWNDRMKARQRYYLTPRVVVPFVDRLIMAGVLTEPVGYSVYWPDLTSSSETEKMDVALKAVQALSAYAGPGNVNSVLSTHDLYTRFLKLTDEEAKAVVAAADKQYEDDMAFDLDQQVEAETTLIDEGLKADPVQESEAKVEALKSKAAAGFPPKAKSAGGV